MIASRQERDSQNGIEALIEFIKTDRNFDFSGYKRNSLTRRINKRMAAVKIEDYSEYLDYLQVHPDEFNELFNTILINVTHFFRDPQTWQFLATEALPQLLERKGEHAHFRAWSVGCASGQEAYTLAMILCELMGRQKFKHRVKIYATDIDEQAIDKARHALYTKQEMEGVSDELRKKYFSSTNSGRYTFDKQLRRSVIFGAHDVVQAAPISRLDLLVCRNTLMYFNSETQNKILTRFHFALNDYGVLFLGMAETMLMRDRFFSPLNQKYRIFRKLPVSDLKNHIAAFGSPEVVAEPSIRHQLYEASFQRDPAARLVVNPEGILLMANPAAFSLFDLKENDVQRPFYELQISYRPAELRPLIEDALSQNRSMNLPGVERVLPDGNLQYLQIHVVPLSDSRGEVAGVEISYIDVSLYRELQKVAEHSAAELEHANEELQSSGEELETSNEELQSTVEELETSNEELQSTNEEMETMNEELQATNDELQSMTDEMRERTDELNQANAFRESILSSAPMSIIVLDRQLRVLMWNKPSESLWGLRSDEAKGQFFLNLDIALPIEKVKNPIRAVLEKNGIQKLELECLDRRGKPIVAHITCSPLIGRENEIAGIILLLEHEEKKK